MLSDSNPTTTPPHHSVEEKYIRWVILIVIVRGK